MLQVLGERSTSVWNLSRQLQTELTPAASIYHHKYPQQNTHSCLMRESARPTSTSLHFISVNAPHPPSFPPIKYKPGAESGSSVAFSLGDAQPNPLPCLSVSGTMSLDPEGSPTVGRDPTSVRRLSSEGCDLRRPINTAKAKAAWVMVPMGSSSRYVKSAGSPLAPPLHPPVPGAQVPHAPTSQEHSSSLPSGKTPNPISLLLFWDRMCPIPLSKLVAGTGTRSSLYNQANAPKEQGAQSCPRTLGEL